jgi:hypothetical protein
MPFSGMLRRVPLAKTDVTEETIFLRIVRRLLVRLQFFLVDRFLSP